MVLRLRQRPAVDPRHPLRGRTVVVDAGHPPGGATGPTGLWEPEAVLGAARALERILTERGARVVMTRTTMDPVALVERPIMARKANGHAFVSLHLDALPDGANPFILQGTGTYFYRMHSEPLARAVQANMFRQMGIRDRGVYSANFAVIRNTWMPAILAEGGFLMIPEQENAFRTPAFQERYARGVADGLEAYFRSLARDDDE
jgi:N-acetylmuramoyl-L-alanine amidase